MLCKAHQSWARASAGALGCARALLLSIPLAVLACGGSAYAAGLRTIALPSAAPAHSRAGALPAEGAAVGPPTAAAAGASSAVAQAAATIAPASASSGHQSGHMLATAAGAAVQAIAAAPEGSAAGGHAASKLLASARNSAPAASEVVADVSRAVSRTLAPVAGGAHVLKARPVAAAQTPAGALAAVSRRRGGQLVAPGREAIMPLLGATTPAAAAAIQRAAEALAGARGRSPSLPFLAPLPGVGGRSVRVLVSAPEAGVFDLVTGAVPAPTREVLSATVWTSRTPCTIAGAEERMTRRCGAASLRVLSQGWTPVVAGAAVLPSRGPPVETYVGGAHAGARSAPALAAPTPGPGSGGPSGSAAGALGSAFPTLLLLASLLLVGAPRPTRRLSLVRQRCIVAPLALIPERPG